MVFLIVLKVARDFTPVTNRYRISPLHSFPLMTSVLQHPYSHEVWHITFLIKDTTVLLLLCKASQGPHPHPCCHLTQENLDIHNKECSRPDLCGQGNPIESPSSQCISYLQLLIIVAWEALFFPKISQSTLDWGPRQKSIKARVNQTTVHCVPLDRDVLSYMQRNVWMDIYLRKTLNLRLLHYSLLEDF